MLVFGSVTAKTREKCVVGRPSFRIGNLVTFQGLSLLNFERVPKKTAGYSCRYSLEVNSSYKNGSELLHHEKMMAIQPTRPPNEPSPQKYGFYTALLMETNG